MSVCDEVLETLREIEAKTRSNDNRDSRVDLIKYAESTGLAPDFKLGLHEKGCYGSPGQEYDFLKNSPMFGLYLFGAINDRLWPLAILGFRWDSGTFSITQLQGQNFKSSLMRCEAYVKLDDKGNLQERYLPKRWTLKLGCASLLLAKDLGFEEAAMIHANAVYSYNRPWGISDSNKDEHQFRMRAVLDGAASQLGFKPDPAKSKDFSYLSLREKEIPLRKCFEARPKPIQSNYQNL